MRKKKWKLKQSHSDTPAIVFAISFWAIIILSMIFGVLKAGEFVFVKTSNAIVSYKEGAPAREEARKKRTVESAKRKVASTEAKKDKAAEKKAKRLAKLQASPSWDDEFGDLMYHADGTLRDPNPGDAYTASQSYWILIFALVAVFCVWAGVGTGTPIGMFIACMFCIILGIMIWSW